MTHFIGAVVVPATVPTTYKNVHRTGFGGYTVQEPNPELDAFLAETLEDFNEQKETPRFLAQTPAQMIADERADIERYRTGYYAKYLADPAVYELEYAHNPLHIAYLRDEFPLKLGWTDAQALEAQRTWYEDEDFDAEGNRWSTVNPEGKWDWYTIGGRWEEAYAEFQGETVARYRERVAAELAAFGTDEEELPWSFPQNIVLPDAERGKYVWHAQGSVGWFGLKTNDITSQEWLASLLAATETVDPNATVVYVDYHV